MKKLTEEEIRKAINEIKAIDIKAGELAEQLAEQLVKSVTSNISDTQKAKLADLIAAAEKQPKAATFETRQQPLSSIGKFKSGEVKRKLNYEVKDRKITVFKSASLKLAFVSTNIAYYTEAPDDVIARVQVDLAKRKRIQPLLKANDLSFDVLDKIIPIGNINTEKRHTYDELVSAGWNVLGNRPKILVQT